MPDPSKTPKMRLVRPDDQAAAPRDPPPPDDAQDAYLVELGQRVRARRSLRGMSRKTLALASQVSERYIAQLEGGRGNISIVLLRRVAGALGEPVEDLVVDPQRAQEAWPLIREMLRGARPETVAAVTRLLQDEAGATGAASEARRRRVALIGLRGAGKSTLGQLAARELGWSFVELNRAIESENGLSITEVFSLYGQEGYRRFELASLRGVLAQPGPLILATGGGIVAEPVTFDLLLRSCFTVWLKAAPEEHMARVRGQGDLRPMANDSAAMAELIAILANREALYARADVVLDTAGKPVERSLAELSELLRRVGAGPLPEPPDRDPRR